MRTHYDNLQVSRDATADLIKAAYRALGRKYHPDRNGGDPQSAKIMSIVNASYAVLSNPARRRKHDEWIEAAEAASSAKSNQGSEAKTRQQSAESQRAGAASNDPIQSYRSRLMASAVAVAALSGLGLGIYVSVGPPDRSGLPSYDQNAKTGEENASLSNDERFAAVFGSQAETPNSSADAVPFETGSAIAGAPNGSPGPGSVDYVLGDPLLGTRGHSTATVPKPQPKTQRDQLVRYLASSANQINAAADVSLGLGMTRIGAVATGDVLTISMALDVARDEIHPASSKRILQEMVRDAACQDRPTKQAIRAGANMVFSFQDRRGQPIFNLTVDRCD